MSIPRVYLPGAQQGRVATLPTEEGAHLTRVLRLGPAAPVQVFDGEGGSFAATVVDATRAAVRVHVGEVAPCAPEPPVRFVVAPALIKGDGFDEVVRDAVMMGAVEVRPVVTAHTVVKPRVPMVDRWRRVALAAVKQSGRAVLPFIDAPVALDQLVDRDAADARLVFVEPAAPAPLTDIRDLPAPASALVLIGPEGGWSPEEIALFGAKAMTFVRIGERTITSERATLAALAVLASMWER